MEHDFDQSDPLRALGLASGATLEEVNRAYRRLLKVYRPERDPEGFQRLREIYEAAKQQLQESAAADQGLGGVLHDQMLADLISAAESAANSETELEGELGDAEVIGGYLGDDEPSEEEQSWNRPASSELEAVEALLAQEDIQPGLDKLVELRSIWKERNPEGWALWLTYLAKPLLLTRPLLAERLIGEASTADLGHGDSFDHVEWHRLHVPFAKQLEQATKDRTIPAQLSDFIRRHVFSVTSQTAVDLVELQTQADAGSWSPKRVFPTLCSSAYEEVFGAWISIVDRVVALLMHVEHANFSSVERTPITDRIEEVSAELQAIPAKYRRPSSTMVVVALLLTFILAGNAVDVWNYSPTPWAEIRFLLFAGGTLVVAATLLLRHCMWRKRKHEALEILKKSGMPLLLFLRERTEAVPPVIAGLVHDHGGSGVLEGPILLENMSVALRSLPSLPPSAWDASGDERA